MFKYWVTEKQLNWHKLMGVYHSMQCFLLFFLIQHTHTWLPYSMSYFCVTWQCWDGMWWNTVVSVLQCFLHNAVSRAGPEKPSVVFLITMWTMLQDGKLFQTGSCLADSGVLNLEFLQLSVSVVAHQSTNVVTKASTALFRTWVFTWALMILKFHDLWPFL